MSRLTLRTVPLIGTDIRAAARAAIELAQKTGVGVELTFNDVPLRVGRAHTVEEVFHDYRRQLADRAAEEDEP